MIYDIKKLLQIHFKPGGNFESEHWDYCIENFLKDYNKMNQTKSKFEQVIENYVKEYLHKEDLAAPFNNGMSGNTSTDALSSVEDAIDKDPSVSQAKQNALKKIQMDLQKKSNTITNP